MARARNIKPSFFSNEVLAEIEYNGRLLFIGLWCLADRAGRLEDRPKRIQGQIFPYDGEVPVEALLAALHQAGFILRYQANGQRFIQVVNFTKHQTPHHREKASTIPAPDAPEAGPWLAQVPPEAGPGVAHLNPDSLNPDIPTTSGALAPPGNAGSTTQATETSDPIFGCCLAFLKAKGCADKGARSFLGLMRKNHGDATVVQAIERAEREDVSDPIPWVRKYLVSRANAAGAEGEIGGIPRRIFA